MAAVWWWRALSFGGAGGPRRFGGLRALALLALALARGGSGGGRCGVGGLCWVAENEVGIYEDEGSVEVASEAAQDFCVSLVPDAAHHGHVDAGVSFCGCWWIEE